MTMKEKEWKTICFYLMGNIIIFVVSFVPSNVAHIKVYATFSQMRSRT